MKRAVTIHVNVWFKDAGFVSTQEAVETVKTVMHEMHHDCELKIAEALSEIGAKDVEVNLLAY